MIQSLVERLREDLLALSEQESAHPLLHICRRWAESSERLLHRDRQWLRDHCGWISFEVALDDDPLDPNPVRTVSRARSLDPEDIDGKLEGEAIALFLMHVADVATADAPRMRICAACEIPYLPRRKRKELAVCSDACNQKCVRKRRLLADKVPEDKNAKRRERLLSAKLPPATLSHISLADIVEGRFAKIDKTLSELEKVQPDPKGPTTSYTGQKPRGGKKK